MARKDVKNFLEKNPAPQDCGVYQFLDEEKNTIYVGKSVNLHRRMLQYLTPSRKKKDKKRKKIVSESCEVIFEKLPTEVEALLRENELIRHLRPKFNVSGAFSFLYPVIATHFDDRQLSLILTTSPDAFDSFARYGAFRDRLLLREVFEGLKFLFSIVGHKEPRSRLKHIPEAPYTSRFACREVDQQLADALHLFFTGESDRFLHLIFEKLLNHPKALASRIEVDLYVRQLKLFYDSEAVKLSDALKSLNQPLGFISQDQRDSLFIRSNTQS